MHLRAVTRADRASEIVAYLTSAAHAKQGDGTAQVTSATSACGRLNLHVLTSAARAKQGIGTSQVSTHSPVRAVCCHRACNYWDTQIRTSCLTLGIV